jgi:DNA-binding SARP family transcriptional activator
MELRLLGPIEVASDGRSVSLGGRQRRTLLAILAVHAGEPVTTDRLIDELWGDTPPQTARKTVQAHIAHLRRALNVEENVLESADQGYVLRLDRLDFDVRRFEDLIGDARLHRATEPDTAADTLQRALSMFRGPPLVGAADDAFSLRIERARLDELRLSAMEDRLDALLASGESESVAAEADALVAEYPLRERIWGLLMVALYRSGRQGEALQAYARARHRLAEELGLDPSSALQSLEQRILDHDSDLETGGGLGTDRGRRPARNPYKGLLAFREEDAADFFGRADLVGRLLERLARRDPTASRFIVVSGPSGSGKSSAVQAGLIPALRGGDLRGSSEWRVIIVQPGDDPSSAFPATLSDGPAGPPTLLVVDQLEEVFAEAEDEGSRRRFIDSLVGVANDPSLPVTVVVTVRTDFLDRLLEYPSVARLITEALELVPPLEEHEIRSIIEEPARGVGVRVEPELIASMTRDSLGKPGALPLLEYALTDVFERRSGDLLTRSSYQDSGGISGAVARRAESLYDRLDAILTPDDQVALPSPRQPHR